MSQHLMNTYARMPISVVRGEGPWLFDSDGKRYLDTVTGIGVCSLGHAHPAVTEAISCQAQTLVHAANVTGIPIQEELADRLTRIAQMDRAFFCNSGAEAIEACFKLARLYGHQKHGIENPVIAVVQGSFHGRTLACLSATDSAKVQNGFEPLVSGFARVPFNNIDALRSVVESDPNIVAMLMEPILGEGGVVPAANGFLTAVRQLCNDHGLLMMLDEVQTGLGKTGDWFAFQHEAARPDALACAKALGNGVPIGACLAQGEAAELFQPGQHGSTYGGNPLACSAALSVIDTIEREALLDRATELGNAIQQRLRSELAGISAVREIRGRGLMIGIELDRPCGALRDAALARGMLINVTRESIVRLLPPLIISTDQADFISTTVARLIRDAYA